MTPAKRAAQLPVDVFVEVVPKVTSGDLMPRVSLPEDFKERAGEVARSVAAVAEQMRSHLSSVFHSDQEGIWAVDTLEIGFDLAVQAEAGVVIARASTGATFSARLTMKAAKDQP